MRQVAHRARAYPGSCYMKLIREFSLSPGWDASLLQGYPLALSSPDVSTHLHIWVERSCVF